MKEFKFYGIEMDREASKMKVIGDYRFGMVDASQFRLSLAVEGKPMVIVLQFSKPVEIGPAIRKYSWSVEVADKDGFSEGELSYDEKED